MYELGPQVELEEWVEVDWFVDDLTSAVAFECVEALELLEDELEPVEFELAELDPLDPVVFDPAEVDPDPLDDDPDPLEDEPDPLEDEPDPVVVLQGFCPG